MQSNIKIGQRTWKSYALEMEFLFDIELGSDMWTLVPSDMKIDHRILNRIAPKINYPQRISSQ